MNRHDKYLVTQSISTLEAVSDIILKINLSNQADYDSLPNPDSEKSMKLDSELENISDAYTSLNEAISFLKQLQ